MTERATHTLEAVKWDTVKEQVMAISQVCSSFISGLSLSVDEQTALGWISVPAKAHDDRNNREANPSATDFFSTNTWFVSENGKPSQLKSGHKGPGGERLEVHIHYRCFDGPLGRVLLRASSPTSPFELSFIESRESPVFRLEYTKDGTNFIFEQNANETRLITDNPGLAKKFDIQNAMINVTSRLQQIVDALKTVATEAKRS